MRRVWLAAWCALSTAAGAALGVGGAGLRTGAGRRVSVGAAVAYANTRLHGRLTVGAVGGSWVGGLDARDVVLRDTAGTVVIQVARLGARYRLRDLVGGLSLGQVTLDTAAVFLVERAGGRFNIEEVLGLGADTMRSSGAARLVAFRDVIIRNAALTVRSRLAPTDTVPETAVGPGGPYRVRRIEGLSATLPLVRVASPLPRDAGFRVEIERFQARISDPRLDVRALQGSVVIRNDSIALELGDVRLPRSVARVRGTLVPTSRGLAINLAIQAAAGASEDIQGLAAQLPPGVDGRGRFAVRQEPGGPLLFTGDPITLVGRNGGGTATGRLGLSVGPRKDWGMRGTRLALDQFDLEYLRTLLDTLPVAGRVSGTFGASGDRASLTTDLDVTFRDSLVAGWPTSDVRGGGVLRLGVPGDIVFDGFALRAGRFDMGTVRRLLPAVHLRGTLDAAGTLDGAWRQVQFSGTVRHADGARPASLARGLVRVDARGDTLGVWADLRVDSINLTGLASELRGLPVRGAFAGDIKLAGYVDSLVVQVDLSGPAGTVAGGGTFAILPPRVAGHDLAFTLRQFDLRAVHEGWLPSRLNGRVTGFASGDTLRAPLAVMTAALDASVLGGAPLDSVHARVVARDSLVGFDSLRAWAPGLDLDAQGGLRVGGAGGADSIAIRARVDSLQLFAPLLMALAGTPGNTPDTVSGAINVIAAVRGTWSSVTVRGSALAPRARWGVVTGSGVTVRGQWGSGAPLAVALDLAAASVSVGQFTFAGAALALRGVPDSLLWDGRSQLGPDAAWAGHGRWWRAGSVIEVPIDSFAARLPDQVWRLDSAAWLTVRDSGVDLVNIALRGVTGAGEIAVAGRHPRQGAGHLRASLTAVPVADVWAVLQRDPRTVGGELSGTLELLGLVRTPNINAKLALKDAVFSHFQAPYVEAALDYHDHRLQGQFGLYRTGSRVVDLGIDLPVDLALEAVPERQLPGPLVVRARADNLDLEFIEALSPLMQATTGRLRADVGIQGSWAAPQLTGAVDVFDASATLPALGVTYRAVNGHLALSGDTIRVDSLRAESGTGAIGVDGTVRLIELTRPEFDLSILAQDFRALDVRNFLSLTASGKLRLQGPMFGARLTGRATATNGVLYFADLITKQIVNLETIDQEMGDTTMRATIERLGLGPELRSRFLDSLRIEALALDMGSDVWLRSSEANIQLSGQVTVGKVGKQYRIDGTLETPRGTYRLPIPLGPRLTISREFAVTRGRVQYFGTTDLNAALDVDAQHVVRTSRGENVTAFVNIGGTLYVPKLTLTSDVRPAISETEIMSYLLAGAPNVGAVAGGGQVQRVASEFAGVLSGQLESALISDLRVPLDYLAIRTGDVSAGLSGTEIAAGVRVYKDVFFTFSPRVCPGQQVLSNWGASLEYRMSTEWRLALSKDAVRGCDPLAGQSTSVSYQIGFDLFWEKSH